MPSFPASIDLDDPDETLVNSFDVPGSDDGTRLTALGDVNGDGIADYLLSIDVAPSYEAEWDNYVVFGSTEPFDPDFTPADLDGTNGYAIEGRDGWRSSAAISAGDLNGDGYADIALVSSDSTAGHLPYADVHVIFGGADGHDGSISVDALDGVTGFTLTGPTTSGFAVYYTLAGAGDINGDGNSDLMVKGTFSQFGFVMGASEPFAPSAPVLDIAPPVFTESGMDLKLLGDINGDGYDETVIGTTIYYGGPDGQPTRLEHGPFSDRMTNIQGVSSNYPTLDYAAAGDVNGDGFDDFIIGDGYAEPQGHFRAGAAYVVFGSAGGLPRTFDPNMLDGSNGFAIRGDYGDFLGMQVAGGFDLNGDGFDDVVAYSNDDDRAYVVYGRAEYHTAGFDLSDIDGRYGFVIENAGDEWVSIASMSDVGDINGDGLDDLAFGEFPLAQYVDSQVHFIFGQLPTEAVTRRDAAGDQTVWGGSGDDTLISYGGDDHLIGGLGNDRLVSSAGTDILDGGLGDDTYVIYRDHADTITDAGGIDTISAKTSWSLMDNPEIENLEFSTAGNWTGQGNGLDNVITAGAGNNRLFGDAGNDTLSGGAGNDLLSGGVGADLLSGGIGADRFDFFEYSTGLGAGRDVITDFEAGVDTINLAYMDANTNSGSNQAFAFIGDAAFTGAAGQLRQASATGGDGAPISLVEGDVNGDGIADFQIELRGTHVLTASDFIL